MNVHLLSLPAPLVHYWRLDPKAIYHMDGREFRLLESEDVDVHKFQATSKPYDLIFVSRPDFVRKHAGGEVKIDPRFLTRQQAYLRTINRDFMLSDLVHEEQERVLFAFLLCQGFDTLFGESQLGLRAEKVNLGKKCLLWLLPKVQAELIELHNSTARRGDALRFSGKLPSTRQFARDWRKYEACRAPAAFARLYRGSSTRRKNANALELQIRLRIQMAFASPKRSTHAALLKRYQGLIHRINRSLKARVQVQLKAVSRKTFCKGIEELDPFYVTLMREGAKVALARFGSGSGGFGLFRPLERVEFDEWKIDLQTLLVELDVWRRMTPRERTAVERSRLWVTVAMDTATRCVLGFKIHHREPCADTAIETLEMALSDKSAIADYIGAGCSFPYSGQIQTALPDNGAAFRSSRFLVATNDAGVELLLPQAGKPQARAHLERAFRTFSNQVLHWFSGRTFSDILTKGDADPETEATVAADEFAKGFFRYLIDEYHHTPHGGLGGETPHDAWLRMTKKYPVEPPPDAIRMRRIFGLEFKRKVTNLGICFLGFQYNSRDLQGLFGTDVIFRLDRYDLSSIAVWTGKRWLNVDATLEVPKGLTVYELEHARSEFQARFAGRAEMHLDFVADAAAAMREIGLSSDRAAGVSVFADRASERDWLNRLDRQRFDGLRIAEWKAPAAERRSLLDLTSASRGLSSKTETYDAPPGYRDTAPKGDADRYEPEDKGFWGMDDSGGDEAAGSVADGFDDADDIGFE